MEHLKTNNLIPEEQKGGIADCYGCIDQLHGFSQRETKKQKYIHCLDRL